MQALTVSDQVVEFIHSPALRGLAQQVDLVLSCGDLPPEYLEYIVSMLNVPMFYVLGNHDHDRPEPEGGDNIDGRVVEYKGLLIAGLEGSIRYNDRPRLQYTENDMRAKIAKLIPKLVLNRARYGRYLDILITHAPPFGIQDGQDVPHRGFKSFLWFMDHYQPRYLIHGHVHVYDSRTETVSRYGATTIVNTYGYHLQNLETASNSVTRPS